MSNIYKAYAIRANGVINIATISPTEEGAKVNWLCTERGFMPLEMHRGEFVRNLFAEHADRVKNVECIAVEVRAYRHAGGELPTEITLDNGSARFTEAPEQDCQHNDPVTAHRGFVRQEIARLTERLDGMDRRIAAQNQGLNDAVGAINRHDDYLNGWAARFDAITHRFSRLENRIGKIEEECALEIEQLTQKLNHANDSISRLEQRLQGVTTIAELLDRIRKLESQTRQVDTGSYAPPRKSIGWINVYRSQPYRPEFVSVIYPSRREADAGATKNRNACVEIFEGDGL